MLWYVVIICTDIYCVIKTIAMSDQQAQNFADDLLGKAKTESPLEQMCKLLREKAWTLNGKFTNPGKE